VVPSAEADLGLLAPARSRHLRAGLMNVVAARLVRGCNDGQGLMLGAVVFAGWFSETGAKALNHGSMSTRP
jgi:hypothetical protein